MEAEAFTRRLNSALEVEDWKIHNEYKGISVLVLYFEDSDR